jgi:signal transduction histidine kinase
VSRAIKATATPHAITVTVEHNLDNPYAQFDPDQIVQVLTNLTSNAVAAMPEGGTLIVRTTGTDDDIRITVADTGTGIARENMSKIFEPFFTTKPIGKGTGLGLAVTYGIVKMHCGDITVESNAAPTAGPTGTTFTVTLPRIGRTSTMTA